MRSVAHATVFSAVQKQSQTSNATRSRVGMTATEALSLRRGLQLDWIEKILLDERFETATDLARWCEIAPSTLSGFIKGNRAQTLDQTTVDRIAAKTGYPQPPVMPPSEPTRFWAAELSRLQTDDSRSARAALAMIAAEPTLQAWTVQTLALELADVLPGDIVVVDPDATPQLGDNVLAEVELDGRRQTVLRRFAAPFLVAQSRDTRFLKPRLIDETVTILGVVVSRINDREANRIFHMNM